jgi:mxaD protein
VPGNYRTREKAIVLPRRPHSQVKTATQTFNPTKARPMTSPFRKGIAIMSLSIATSSALADGQLSASREIVVDRAPTTVWKLLGEFNALDIWLPPVQASTFSGDASKPGAIRVLDLGNRTTVTEELVAYSDTERAYSYKFLESPLPVKNYVATLQVRAAPGGKSQIQWRSTFEAAGVSDEKAREAILGIYDAGLTKIAVIFGQ